MRKWWRRVASFGLGILLTACGGSTNHNGEGPARVNGAGGASMAGSAGTGVGGASTAGASGAPPAGGASCDGVACAPLTCAVDIEGQPLSPQLRVITPSGECCAVCEVEPSCDNVRCTYNDVLAGPTFPPHVECPAGYDTGITPGACCYGCVRNAMPLDPPSCDSGCPDEGKCQTGYMPQLLSGSCCRSCVPDPAQCNVDADCVVAAREGDCCGGCPVAISVRMSKADACWRGAGEARPSQTNCEPRYDCTLVDCAPCPPIENFAAACIQHHCELKR